MTLPPVAYRGNTIGRGSLRHVIISDKEYDKLRMEVMGSDETGYPARPELEIFTVGVGGQRVKDLEKIALGKYSDHTQRVLPLFSFSFFKSSSLSLISYDDAYDQKKNSQRKKKSV